MGTEGHGLFLLDLVLLEPRVVKTEVHVVVLQIALTGLVADRAVERVIDQQELQHRAPALLGLVALGLHDHSLDDRRIAGDLELWELFNLHKADAAVACDGEPGVVAIARNEDPQLLRGLDDHGSLGHAYLMAVDAQGRHTVTPFFPTLRPLLMYSSNSSRNFLM